MDKKFEEGLEAEFERECLAFIEKRPDASILADTLGIDSFSYTRPDNIELIKENLRQDFIHIACSDFVKLYDKYRITRRRVCHKEIERARPSWWAGYIRTEGQGRFWVDLEKADDPSFTPNYCSIYTADETKSDEEDYLRHAQELKSETRIERYLATQRPFINAKSYLLKGNKTSILMLSGEVLSPLITEEREFDLAFVRVIAGAMLAYNCPEQFESHALKAGAIQLVTPDSRTQDLAKELTDRLALRGIDQPRALRTYLSNLSQGRLPRSHDVQYSTDLKRQRQAFVREITLLGRRRFVIKNGKKNRFPPAAILAAFDLVETNDAENMVSSKTIENWQQKLDAERLANDIDDPDYALGIPLTDHRFNSLYNNSLHKKSLENRKNS